MIMNFLENLNGYKVSLASASPRRRELMQLLCIPFEVADPIDIDEIYPAGLDARSVPEYLSRLKAEAYRKVMGVSDLFITADTVVIVDDQVIGKPCDENDACRMLEKLSGRKHTVVTGVTLCTLGKMASFSVCTDVDFAPLSDDEIRFYVDRFRPLDKAGAYGIQEWIGAVGISGVEGSFYNVMGLPVHRLWTALRAFTV